MSAENQDALADEWAAALEQQAAADAAPATVEEATETAVSAPQVQATLFKPFASGGMGGGNNDIEMILDIPVQLTVELGRTRIPIKHILQLAQGSVIELDALAGEPMDVLVNGCLIAQGEVVVVNDKFGIRLTDIVTPSERMKRLNRN
jgi:flagellar motor switch protein FliN/FliY